jgi:hypothetical protein
LYIKDLRNNFKDFGENTFGNKIIDKPTWLKFWFALDSKLHYDIKLIDNSIITVFDCLDRVIQLNEYLKTPDRMIFVPEENIKEIYHSSNIIYNVVGSSTSENDIEDKEYFDMVVEDLESYQHNDNILNEKEYNELEQIIGEDYLNKQDEY